MKLVLRLVLLAAGFLLLLGGGVCGLLVLKSATAGTSDFMQAALGAAVPLALGAILVRSMIRELRKGGKGDQ